MSTTTSSATTLRYLLGSAPRPDDVCPTLGRALQSWLGATQPLTPNGITHHQLLELAAHSNQGPESSVHRSWRIADHLARSSGPRFCEVHPGLHRALKDLPQLTPATSGELLRRLTVATRELPSQDPGRRTSTARTLADGGIGGLLEGSCTHLLTQPLAAAIAVTSGELLLRAAAAVTPEEAHHLAAREQNHTLSLLTGLVAEQRI